MAKKTIEIDVPDGMQINKVEFLYPGVPIVHFEPIRKATKWRPPTKLDLLGVDSIPGRARDSEADPWLDEAIRAVATCGGYRYVDTDGNSWCYAEIEVPIDEQPPREAWVRYIKEFDDPREAWVRYIKEFDDPWRLAYGNEKSANNTRTNGGEVIRMIEVREPINGG